MTDEPQAAQTPLIDLLRGTPKDATADYEHNPTSHSHIPYGYQAHQAADEIDRLNELLELAWGLIANANEGFWERATSEWREAAEKWRDKWLEKS